MDDFITCPICGYEYSHIDKVEVYTRDKEDGNTYLLIPGSKERIPVNYNPSSRRDAVRIHIKGECDHRWWIDIIQHKGINYIEDGFNKTFNQYITKTKGE